MKSLILSIVISTSILGFHSSVVGQTSEFDFQHQVKMDMGVYKKDELKNSMDYTFLFPKTGNYFGVEMEMAEAGMNTKSIFDYDAMTMTTLMDHPSMKMGSQYDLSKVMEMATSAESDGGEMKKTGKTKSILGYTCQEYVMTTEDGGYAEVWITNDLDFENVYQAFAAMNKKQKQLNMDMPNGFFMELTSWPDGKDGKDKITMNVKEVNLNQPTSISTNGYSIMKLN
ncbi:hypothetical protein Oweho_2811 [Owenweeksia hongkongensis DSM 17368]|uniref:DUF4412 domain-containing protein n=1 Tax=Owenweeksia hongkongensis (strain DSM 17368 / CIP 108786 / JCM 12287 / NRRL B-23963 / UST20020801) TaxID=926562 RepID=G8R0P4_OWEHD|nr:hypothetical protein [Owenweeksia hongkongensis]AEV33771.1 hypothetical protein Oweho_2811 [Owenweeksia hongkongensis DSM 17368]